jgi:hypothetical protein
LNRIAATSLTPLFAPFLEQIDETWLAEFQDRISTPWDFTAIHINKNSLDGVKQDIVSYLPSMLDMK